MTILAKAVMIGQRTMEEQKRRIAEQQSRIVELEPKALFADAVAASDARAWWANWRRCCARMV